MRKSNFHFPAAVCLTFLAASCGGGGGGVAEVGAGPGSTEPNAEGGAPAAEPEAAGGGPQADRSGRSLSMSAVRVRTTDAQSGSVEINPVCASGACVGSNAGIAVSVSVDSVVETAFSGQAAEDPVSTDGGVTLVKRTWSGAGEQGESLVAALDQSSFGVVVERRAPAASVRLAALTEREDRRVYAVAYGELAGTRPVAAGVWRGRMSGVAGDPVEFLQGDATLTYSLSDGGGSLSAEFTGISSLTLDAAHSIPAVRFPDVGVDSEGSFSQGSPGDRIQGAFYGSGLDEIAGTFERSGIIGAYGALAGAAEEDGAQNPAAGAAGASGGARGSAGVPGDAQRSVAWFERKLVRAALAPGDVAVPGDGTNAVTIARRPRTKPDGTLNAGDGLIDSGTFRSIIHEEGNKVFSGGGVEFKVRGYVGYPGPKFAGRDYRTKTGLKLTDAGLEFRTGHFMMDYSDGLKDVTSRRTGRRRAGQVEEDAVNHWDLAISFDEPRTVSVAGGATSWTGSGAWHWRGIVPLDDSQKEGGENHAANAFIQPPESGQSLGAYEVWLSNLVGEDSHLSYAAYGMFAYEADDNLASYNRFGRLQSMHFGYEAFGDSAGGRTADIDEAITGGKFEGRTLATAVKGYAGGHEKKLLRGNVHLTVSIPKTTGRGTLSGTMDSFEEWTGSSWTVYSDDFEVALDDGSGAAVGIGPDGSFNGWATISVGGAPLPFGGNDDLNAGGVFKGNFYGPRAGADLEVAGSWHAGISYVADTGYDFEDFDPVPSKWSHLGSFGAKRKEDLQATCVSESDPCGSQ